MKTSVALLMLGATLSHVLAAPFRFGTPESFLKSVERKEIIDENSTPFCRLFQGPSRCVDAPLPIEDEEPWCPYRMCAPSYVPAELCPAERELAATNKCRVHKITRDIYKCDGKAFGHNYVPIGCEKGTPGCNEVPTCSCFKVEDITTTVLKDTAPFKPDCSK